MTFNSHIVRGKFVHPERHANIPETLLGAHLVTQSDMTI